MGVFSTAFAVFLTNEFGSLLYSGFAGAVLPFLLLFWSAAILMWIGVYVGYRARSASIEEKPYSL